MKNLKHSSDNNPCWKNITKIDKKDTVKIVRNWQNQDEMSHFPWTCLRFSVLDKVLDQWQILVKAEKVKLYGGTQLFYHNFKKIV